MSTHFTRLLSQLRYRALQVIAIIALVLSMGGTWMIAADVHAAPGQTAASTAAITTGKPTTATTATTAADDDLIRSRPLKKEVVGKININTATEDQLMLLPTVGPSKAERVVVWRKKNGGFKRPADLRRVKGFGYKTFKRLEPFLDIKGDTTLAPAMKR
jgi:competence ComEA-like helix-hairpin-helix protein